VRSSGSGLAALVCSVGIKLDHQRPERISDQRATSGRADRSRQSAVERREGGTPGALSWLPLPAALT
jgi:hypothetical protein